MRGRTIFGVVFLTFALAEITGLAGPRVTILSQTPGFALLVVCIGGGWMGVRRGTPWRGILAVWSGAFCANVVVMAVYILTGAALENRAGPAVVWVATIAAAIYTLVLAVAGAGAAALARVLTRRRVETPAA